MPTRKTDWRTLSGKHMCGHLRVDGLRNCRTCDLRRARKYRVRHRASINAKQRERREAPSVPARDEQYVLPCFRRGPAPRIQPTAATVALIESCRDQFNLSLSRGGAMNETPVNDLEGVTLRKPHPFSAYAHLPLHGKRMRESVALTTKDSPSGTPGSPAHGAPERVGRLRGYGNGIVLPQAIAFIESYEEARHELNRAGSIERGAA